MEVIKKKICWITPDYYLCVDSFVVPHLMNEYEIQWILINSRNTKRKADGLINGTMKPREYNLAFRQKDPRIIWQYIKILRDIRKLNFDLIYISFHGFPFFFPLFLKFINPQKVIWGVHNVITPKGGSNERWMDVYQKYGYKRIRNFQVFSSFQLDVIKKIIPNKKHYYAPLTLKDYGTSSAEPPKEVIRFLFFGYIRQYKRLDLLLKSFQDLYYSGTKNIELYIAGNCENWKYYQSMITVDKAILQRIEIIPNKDIPDIVSSCHYMVLPYQDSAQSGVLTLGYKFNKPIIASNIQAFKQFIVDKETGYFFESESQQSLTNVLASVVTNHKSTYHKVQANLKDFVETEFSIEKIVSKYKVFLNECIQNAV